MTLAALPRQTAEATGTALAQRLLKRARTMRTLILSAVVMSFLACGEMPGGGGTGGGSGGGSGGSGGSSGGFKCTQGTLFAGNPLHNDPMARPADGTGLLEDPPFLYRQIVFSNGQLITHNGREIWRANLSDKILHRIAGSESGGQELKSGACAQARFANIFHIALASDGSLFISDQTANAVLKMTDPLGAGCSVGFWAGTSADTTGITPASVPNQGDTDGPGAMAKFRLPERMAVDGSDNVYVWDQGNNSIRKIANDAMHTVSKLVPSITPGGAAVVSQAFLDGKLFVYGIDGNDVFLNSYDSGGVKTELFKGRATIFGGSSSDSMTVGGITTDGTALYVFFNGQVFRIDTAGKVSEPLAGKYQPGLDFSSGYDPKVAHTADKVEIVARSQVLTAGLSAFVAMDANKDIYVAAQNLNKYVVKLECE